MLIFLCVYGFMCFVIASLSLAQIIHDGNYDDDDWFELSLGICGSAILGLTWPITIWAAIIFSLVKEDTPTWLEILKNIFTKFKEIMERIKK